MRDQWLNIVAGFGAVGALLLPAPAFAQAQTAAPPPSMFQTSPTGMPDMVQTQAPDQGAAPAPSPGPGEQSKPPEKAKTRAKATALAKKPSKTTTAKARPMETAPGAQAAMPADGMPAGKMKRAARLRGAVKLNAARAPRDIVGAIYQVSAGKDGSYSGPSAFDDSEVRHLYFSKGLAEEVAALQAKSAGEPILNFDPITNSEGPDVQDLDIAIESQQPDRMIVMAKFKSTEDSSILHYDFVKEGNLWKLDDIRGEISGQPGQWSLREILKNSLQRS